MPDYKVFGYNRVSTADQVLDRGRDTIYDYCKTHGFTLDRIFEDFAKTGGDFERPEYQKLKDFVRKGDVVIFSELDRFGRTFYENISEIGEFKNQKECYVIFCNIPTSYISAETIDKTLPDALESANQMMLAMLSMQAKMELDNTKKRSREGIKSKLKRIQNNMCYDEWDTWQIYKRKMDYNEFAKIWSDYLNDDSMWIEIKGAKRFKKSESVFKDWTKSTFSTYRKAFSYYLTRIECNDFETFEKEYIRLRKTGATHMESQIYLSLDNESFQKYYLKFIDLHTNDDSRVWNPAHPKFK